MSGFWHSEAPAPSAGDTLAGGEADILSIFSAGIDQYRFTQNVIAENEAMDRAIFERNEEVYRATGTRPRHPFMTAEIGTRADKLARWKDEVSSAAARIPDTTVADRLQRSIEGDAARIGYEAQHRFDQLSASRPGFAGWAAGMAGAMVGALRDPIVFASLGLGFGVGAGRTVAGRVLVASSREAVVNGALTAAVQPAVQDWRRRIGVEAGFDEAIREIAFATVLGGAFGAAGQGLSEGLSRISGRALESAAAELSVRPETPAMVKAALQGDPAAARELLDALRAADAEALPPIARGALDHAETLEHLETTRPRAALAEHHDVTVSAAHRAVERQREPDAAFAGFEPDPDQVARIADELIGPVFTGSAERPKSLVDFLIDAGGVSDEGGELGFLDASRVSRRFRGKLVKETGKPLDAAREIAEEAGYIGRAGETQSSTVPDLLEAIDRELRGQPVYSRADEGRVAELRDLEAERARVEELVARAARAGGPALDDDLLRNAVEISARDGIEPEDAVERVLTRAELDGTASVASRAGDIPPGWTDAELDAAAARRGNPPDDKGGIDDVRSAADELAIDAADIEAAGGMLIPADDGALVSPSRMMEDIDRAETFSALVKACRT